MRLEETRRRIQELLSSTSDVVDFLRSIGFQSAVLEETERLLGQLVEHIEVLQTEESLGLLEIELRKTSETLDSLRDNLLSYPEPNQELIAEVDAAQDEIIRNLLKVKRAKKTKSALPLVVLGAVVLVAAIRR